MTTKQSTIIWVCDNLDAIKESGYETIAEAIVTEVNNNGTIDNWDDDDEGMTSGEFIGWVNSTYNFSAEDEKAEQWADNIKYNEF